MTDERITLTVEEAAKLLGISVQSAYTSIQRGDFPVEPIKVGARILIPRAALMRLAGAEAVPA